MSVEASVNRRRGNTLLYHSLIVGHLTSVSHSVMSSSLQPHVAHQAPLSMEPSRQEHWSGQPSPSPGNLPEGGTEPASPALKAGS